MARGRDYAMALSGALIVGAGLTFVIKSGKTPRKDSQDQSRVEIKAWNPISQNLEQHETLHR